MNRILTSMMAFVLALVLLMGGVAPARAEDTAASLHVEGTGSVTIPADYATLTLGVTTSRTTVEEASKENADIMKKVLDALAQAGVAEKDIQTAQFQINPNIDYRYGDANGQQVITGYQVTNQVSVTLWDLDKAGQVLDAAVAAGVNESGSIAFRSTKEQEAADEAMKNAVAEAQRKAGLLAEAAGRTLGSLTSIQETSDGYYPLAKEMSMDSSAGTPIMKGGVTVSCTVSMTYQLNP